MPQEAKSPGVTLGVTADKIQPLGSSANERKPVFLAQSPQKHTDRAESAVPIREDVHAACEMLGLDPLHVANEGRFIAFVPARDTDLALQILRGHHLGAGSAVIGQVTEKATPLVVRRSGLGVRRILDMPSGEQLPRIC